MPSNAQTVIPSSLLCHEKRVRISTAKTLCTQDLCVQTPSWHHLHSSSQLYHRSTLKDVQQQANISGLCTIYQTNVFRPKALQSSSHRCHKRSVTFFGGSLLKKVSLISGTSQRIKQVAIHQALVSLKEKGIHVIF